MTIEHICSKIAVINRIFPPATKVELMKFIGSKMFFLFVDKLHVNMKPVLDKFLEGVKNHRDNDMPTMFRRCKTSIAGEVTLISPIANYPFFLFGDTFLFGIGSVLLQLNNK